MKQILTKGAIFVAIAVGGLSVAGPAAAHPGHDQHNFGSHVSHCAHVMGGFSGDHNPSMMRGTSLAEHSCHM